MAFAVAVIGLFGLFVIWILYLSAAMCIGAAVFGIILMVKRNDLYDWEIQKRKRMTIAGRSLFCFGVFGIVALIAVISCFMTA